MIVPLGGDFLLPRYPDCGFTPNMGIGRQPRSNDLAAMSNPRVRPTYDLRKLDFDERCSGCYVVTRKA